MMLWVTCAAAAYVLFPASLNSTRHVPAPEKVTLPSLSEHPVEEPLSVIATLSPEVAVAVGVYVPRVLPALGAALALIEFDVVPAANAGSAVRPSAPSVRVRPTATFVHRSAPERSC